MSFGSKARREERLNAYYAEEDIIDEKKYNLVLGGVVLEGLIVNYILCLTVGNVYDYINPIAFFIGYLILGFLGIFIAQKSKNPFISFIGYNMLVVPCGLTVSTCVYMYGGVDSSVVREAFLLTAIITATMVAASTIFPGFFATIGKALFGCLFGCFIAGIIALIIGIDQTIISFAAAVVFSFYIGYDFYRAQQFEKTYDNAVDCALDIYLDIINLFLRLIRILGKKSRK